MIVVVDTETTGLDPVNDRICELASVIVWDGEIGTTHTTLVNPEREIPIVASGIHHITDEHVRNAPVLKRAIPEVIPLAAAYYAAHNAQFDRQFLPMLQDKDWICTYKCAQRLLPNAPSYSNQALRYYLKLHVEEMDGRAGQPHSALYDARTTAKILIHLLGLATAEELVQITREPTVLNKMPFGKYRGLPFTEVPKDYLQWLKGRDNLDEDLSHTLAKHV